MSTNEWSAEARRYQAKYCEENIWWLAQSEEPGAPVEERRVLFISSPTQSCLFFCQRESEPVVWDYHVVLWVRGTKGAEVWDLDTVLDVPCDAQAYLRASFPHRFERTGWHAGLAEALKSISSQDALAEGKPDPALDFSPHILAVDATSYIDRFSSNRKHMRRHAGEWYAPPPPWPCIEQGDMQLSELMALRGDGRHYDLEALMQCAIEDRLP